MGLRPSAGAQGYPRNTLIGRECRGRALAEGHGGVPPDSHQGGGGNKESHHVMPETEAEFNEGKRGCLQHLRVHGPAESRSAPEFIDITDRVSELLIESRIRNGFVLVSPSIRTAAITIQENEPLLLNDMASLLERLAPRNARYGHNDFGIRTVHMDEDECPNGHSHCQHLMLGSSETIPVIDGELALGRYQERPSSSSSTRIRWRPARSSSRSWACERPMSPVLSVASVEPAVDEAYARCAELAKSHYENFTVGSWLLPKEKRRHIYAIYAFCRTVDDLGDEHQGIDLQRSMPGSATFLSCY